jgi:hypothetical protein
MKLRLVANPAVCVPSAVVALPIRTRTTSSTPLARAHDCSLESFVVVTGPAREGCGEGPSPSQPLLKKVRRNCASAPGPHDGRLREAATREDPG